MKRLIPAAALLLATPPAAPLFAQEANAPFTLAETGQGFARLQDALNALGDREGTVLIAPGSHRQCAVQTAGAVTFRAAQPGTAILDGVACEGKAALVLRGRGARVDGIVFQNIHVPDGNGAGIRLERGNLAISNSLFRNSEQGMLTADDPAASISIDRSTFSHLGRCDRDLPCAHSIYIGHYGALTVTRSRFEKGDGGHYVKARAARVTINDNSFDDSAGRMTNYMIDLPNGAAGIISGNEMVQGRDKDNYSAFIAIAAEGRERDSSGLVVRGNAARFVPGLSRASTFLANWTDDAVRLEGNSLGAGIRPADRR